MDINQYNDIVNRIKSDSLERQIYIEIEGYLKNKGLKVSDISYDKYMDMRKYLIDINSNGLVRRLSGSKKKITEDDKNQIIGTIVLMLIFIAIASISDVLAVFGYTCAIITAVVGFGTLSNFPYVGNTEYVDKYFQIQEDAMLNMNAYLHQAFLHSGQIKMLNDKINGIK